MEKTVSKSIPAKQNKFAILRKALNYGVFNFRKNRHKSRIKRTLSRFLNACKF